MDSSTTVHTPVRHIATIALANLTGLDATDAAPSECAAAPVAIPTDTSSSTPCILRTLVPIDAPIIPVKRLMALVSVGSAPVILLAARASGVVIALVRILAWAATPETLRTLDPSAELTRPDTAVKRVDRRNRNLLRFNSLLYLYCNK